MTDPEFDRLISLIHGGMGFMEANAQVERERNQSSTEHLKAHMEHYGVTLPEETMTCIGTDQNGEPRIDQTLRVLREKWDRI